MNLKKGAVTAYTIMTVMALAFLLPLLWIVLASLDTNAGVGLKMPTSWTLENYQAVVGSEKNRQAFLVGLLLSLGQTAIVVVVSALASYPLSRYELKYKRSFMYTILFMSALPITTVMVPVYKLFLILKLMDHLLGVILFMSAASLPYAMWMMKNFMDTVPIELEEAAWVDGANTIQSIIYIVTPLMLRACVPLRSSHFQEAGEISLYLTSCCNQRINIRHPCACISILAKEVSIMANWRPIRSSIPCRQSYCI